MSPDETQPRHILVPLHEKCSEEEKAQLLEKYNLSLQQIPKIPLTDAALAGMDVKPGDMIRITRQSATAGEVVFYRGVSHE
mgnify:CR=1 FL=1